MTLRNARCINTINNVEGTVASCRLMYGTIMINVLRLRRVLSLCLRIRRRCPNKLQYSLCVYARETLSCGDHRERKIKGFMG